MPLKSTPVLRSFLNVSATYDCACQVPPSPCQLTTSTLLVSPVVTEWLTERSDNPCETCVETFSVENKIYDTFF